MNGIATQTGLDPAIGWALRLVLAAIFARAVYAKLRDPREFADAIRAYELLPAPLCSAAAAALLAAELALLVGLLLPATGSAAAGCAAGLLLLYSAAIVVNLLRGRRDIDCGCAGPLRKQPLHELLVLRNLLYAAIAGIAALPLAARELVWLDAATIGFCLLSSFMLSLALDGLAAVAPAFLQSETSG